MGIQKFLKNRYNIVYTIIILLLVVLAFRMSVLTIVQGESYRQTADVKKIKDIPVKAPRGKIYDRNGVVLADNITSFTLQMYTDQIKQENFNDVSYTLAKILDENGERPIDDFPIQLDKFDYENEQLARANVSSAGTSQQLNNDQTYQSAEEKVIGLVKANIYEWINYKTTIYNEEFSIKKPILNLLKKQYEDIPIDIVNGEFAFVQSKEEIKENESGNKNQEEVNSDAVQNNNANNQTVDTDPVKIWLQKYQLKSTEPNSVVAEILTKENKYLNNLFSISKVRKLSYDFIKAKNISANIKLVPYSFVQDENLKNLKSELSGKYEEITDTTTAKDDFVFLTMKYSIDNLLKTVYNENNKKFAPGNFLCDKLKEIYGDLPVKFVENGETGSYEYTDEAAKEKYLNQLHLDKATSAYDFVKEMAVKNYDVLYNFITADNVKYYSQLELLKYENPNISIADWEYTPIRDKRIWINKNLESDKDTSELTAEQVFKMLRESLEITQDVNDYDLRNMLVIRERYNKTNYLSYHPVDICYELSEKSVAMISERAHELDGINVEIEPIRNYPYNSSAAHILGYLGKISQDYEVDKYVSENGYDPDDIIGKTGIEEKFEDYLNGEKGKKTVEVNNIGKTIKSVSNQAPVPGDDLYLTLDIRLQKKAEEALKKGLEELQKGGAYESEWGTYDYKDPYANATSAALVALDVKTGEVLALANYPSYDLNLFSTGISSEDWNSLLNDSKNPLAPKPLYNISLLTAIQPGSTFKMVTALAALEKGVNPETKVYCAGTEKVGDRNFSCWIYNMFHGAHGYENMYEAIRDSCNFYFYTTVLGENLATNQKHTVKVNAEEIIEAAGKLGLNSKTGIEIDTPQEYSGGVPSIEGKKVSIRVYLRLFLEANIEKYLQEGSTLDESMKNEVIEEIVSWIDRDVVMTRGEVYEGLKTLKLNPDKTNDSGVPLTDIIKYSYLNQAVWTAGDNLNMSIGQGSNSYTTIQMANYIATIANGGYRHNVSVVKGIKTYEGEDTDYVPLRTSERIELKDYSHLDVLKEGMRLVSESSSGKPYANFPVTVGSKTGTAQKEGTNPDTGKPYDEFAWYVAFAPYDNPQIAVACVIFQGGLGGNPTPIVRDVIGEYLKVNGITGN